MATIDPLSPTSSPGKVAAKKAGVRRVNNMPLFILLAALGVFLIVMVLVASDRAARNNEKAVKAVEKGGDASRSAKDIVGDNQEGVVRARPLDVPALPQGTPVNLDAPPMPPELNGPGPGPMVVRDENEERIRMLKMQRLEEANRAKIGVKADGAARSGGGSGLAAQLASAQQQITGAASTDPTAAYRARLAQIQNAGLLPGGSGASGGGVGGSGAGGNALLSASGRGNDYSQFNSSTADRWRLDQESQAPRSPYELRAGFVIPATLISGINSDLPGQIIAQVSQDVFDTATGKFRLVPQGSRLVGAYSSSVAFGQSRVLVAWQRIVFPDGKALDIGSMPGADGAGYAGFNDKVNNHYLRTFGSALLMSAVVAGVAYSQQPSVNSNNVNQQTAGSSLSEALGQQLGQVMAQMVSKNLNVSPTLEIRPGFRFNVVVTKDLTFSKPYTSFDY